MKAIALSFMFFASLCHSYGNDFGHNRMAFISHEFLKQCGEIDSASAYTPADIAHIVDGSTSVDTSWGLFSIYNRLFDWHFYNDKFPRSKWLLGDRTFIDPWRKLLEVYPATPDKKEKLKLLGGFAHFIEDMANPAHVIPVFHMVGIADGVDDFQSSYYQSAPKDLKFNKKLCVQFQQAYQSLIPLGDIADISAIRDWVVKKTKNELTQSVDHCPDFKWHHFYETPKDGEFWGDFHHQSVTGKTGLNKTKKVVIGFEGRFLSEQVPGQSCVFTREDYQPFIDRLFESAILGDAILLKSQAGQFGLPRPLNP